MKSTFILFFLVGLLNITAYSQNKTYNSSKDSDAKSQAILKKLQAFYNNNARQITSSFQLKIDLPDQNTRIEKGTIIQSGTKFNLKVKEMTIINNGKALWMINKTNKEIQINDYSPGNTGGTFNPTDVIRMYNPSKFVSVCTFDGKQGNSMVQIVEIKPLDKNADYAKARITVNKSNTRLTKIELFNKDGSKYYLTISGTTISNKPVPSNFVFNAANYPKYHIEDLRVN
jgi:outer membrane lipoprotein-sorting protein